MKIAAASIRRLKDPAVGLVRGGLNTQRKKRKISLRTPYNNELNRRELGLRFFLIPGRAS